MTLADYAAHWARLEAVRDTTRGLYRSWLARVWLPAFGDVELAAITRRDVLSALERQRERGLGAGTLRSVLGVLRALLSDARDDGLIIENVATRLGRLMGPRPGPRVTMDRVQLCTFLRAANRMVPEQLPLFLTLARAGLRVGEVLGLHPADVDIAARELRVERIRRPDGSVAAPKTRHSRRRVDVSRQLSLCLASVTNRDRPWLFGTRHDPLPYHAVRRDFAKVRDALGLPRGLTPHSLRHTYASLLIASGVSPAYVMRQLGHSSIALTLDLYGRHVPFRDLAAVDRLDDPAGRHVSPDAWRRLRSQRQGLVQRDRDIS